ncbi:hypothetical protein HYT23_04530 [Candidatus Pacearchaeota archaeon]|nr:hypothetical protein [Candidatus Pacearchaeota archaeon]
MTVTDHHKNVAHIVIDCCVGDIMQGKHYTECKYIMGIAGKIFKGDISSLTPTDVHAYNNYLFGNESRIEFYLQYDYTKD